MPSQSKQQQKFMGMIHALKKGDIKPSDVSQSVKDAAKSMSKKDAKDFASTPHKGLPKKVKQEILKKLKEYANKMAGNKHGGSGSYGYAPQKGLRDDDGYDNVDYNRDMPRDESVNERMDKRQAGELIKQLGGNRFIAMTGAKNFVVGPKGAGFKIGKNSKGINYVRIDLDGRDLYNMEFIQARGGNMKVKAKEKGVYFDQLRKLFTKNTGMYTTLEEGMFSTLDQIRQDSKDVRDFVKNVFKDRDFMKMKNDKEFIKYLKSIYEGVDESKGVPQNYMQGRVSDYHTALRGKNRDYSGGTNFKKSDSGQPDIEDNDEDQETNSLSEEMGNLSSSERIELYKLYSKAMRAMPGSPNQKKIKVLINKIRKKANLKPLPISEYGQRLDLSYLEDMEMKLKGTPTPKDAINRDIDEYLGGSYEYTKGDQYGQNSVNEIGIFPVQNYVDGIIPSSFIDTTTRDKKERLKSTLRDLKNTLNHFWKQHKIPYRIR